MRVPNTTELYTYKWLRQLILYYVQFYHSKKNGKNEKVLKTEKLPDEILILYLWNIVFY